MLNRIFMPDLVSKRILIGIVIVVALASIGPLLFMVIHSFTLWDTANFRFTYAWSLHPYSEALRSDILRPLASVFTRSAVVATVECILAIPVGLALVRRSTPKQRLAYLVLVTLPFFVCQITRTFSWSMVLGGKGAVNELIALLTGVPVASGRYGFALPHELAIGIAIFAGSFAFALVPMTMRLTAIPVNVWAANESLGGGYRHELLTIALPACRATVGLSWLIVFFFSLQASVEVIMLKGTREQGLFDLTGTLWRQESYPAAFALGVIVLTGAGVILMIVLLLTGSSAVGKVRRSAG